MLKKIVKYTLRTLLVILLAALLIPALLYVPAVQDFIRGKAVGYASEALAWSSRSVASVSPSRSG